MNQVYTNDWSNYDNKDLEAVIQFPRDMVGKTEDDCDEGNADDYKYNEDSSDPNEEDGDFAQGEGSKKKRKERQKIHNRLWGLIFVLTRYVSLLL